MVASTTPLHFASSCQMPDLDEELQNRILTFATEPKASAACHVWKDKLYKSLHLKNRIEWARRLSEKGQVVYDYSAVRPLAEDFEESVGYNFRFAADGTYRMQWTRVWDAWSSQSEQHFGHWRVDLDELRCETAEPNHAVNFDREVRFAQPGFKFRVPIEDILMTNGTYYTAPLGSPAATWEQAARTGKEGDDSIGSVRVQGMWEPVEATRAGEREAFVAPVREDARFVEIDGDMHEVSGDIVTNFPEERWAVLMRCRLRFGING